MIKHSSGLVALCLVASSVILPANASDSTHEMRIDQAFVDLKTLSADDMQGRKVGTEGGAKARTYLLGRMKAIGLKPYGDGYEQDFTFQPRSRDGETRPMVDGVNLIAKIKGKSSEHTMVISAHYDHLGVRGEKTYNGADDNASGVAAVLAIADAMQLNAPDYDVIIALFDGEEMGLQGGQAFVTALETKITLNMNLDMVSQNDKAELYVAGSGYRSSLKPIVEGLVDKLSVSLKIGHDTPGTGSDDWTFGSDHGAFHRADIPFLYFGVEDHADYHQPTDTYEQIPVDFYRNVVASMIISAYEINNALDEVED